MERKKSSKGFTLVEIIIVIGLLVVIAGIFSVNLIKTLRNQNREAEESTTSQIVSAANAYVSMNPEAVEKLYNSYGYVDIPVGTLRDAGFLSEEIKNVETGENVSDDELVRVRFDVLDHLEYTYPAVKGDQDSEEAWALVNDNITIIMGEYTGEDWCSVEENKYSGLIRNPSTDYGKYKSNLYLINNKPGEEQGRMYSGDYFATGEDGVNLRATSCNVNAQKIGTYNITYTYRDPETHIERSSNRTVFVRPDVNDISSFTAEFLTNPIVKGFSEDRVQVSIEETLLDGSKVKLPPIAVSELEKKGYKLTGFSTASVVTNKDATLEKVKANSDGSKPNPTTRKMKYTVYDNTYTLTFNGNGGTPSKTNMSVKYEEPYGTLATATRTGYTQNGWWTSSSGGNEIKSTSIFRQVSNQTVYAHWTANEYTVTFNPNGSSVSPTSKTVTYDSTYGDLPTPSARTGYNFDGWYTSATGGTKITSSSRVTTAGNHTLYAHWTGKPYTVYFQGNGGSVSPTSKTVNYYQSYGTLPTPTRAGYTFKGWYTSTSGGTKITSSSTFTQLSNQYLYAQWTANTMTVYFNANGGSVSPSSRTYTAATSTTKYNASGSLPTPTRAGYTFNGWYTSSSGGTYKTNTSYLYSTGSHTLYAHWTQNSMYVTYNANGGSVSPSGKYIYGATSTTKYGTLATPTKSGYAFDGWTAPNGTYKNSSSYLYSTASHTLNAQWKLSSWTINFVDSCPSKYISVPSRTYTTEDFIDEHYLGGLPSDEEILFGNTHPMISCPGYTYGGWWTSTSGGSRVYNSTFISTLRSNNIKTLYSRWTYSGGGGSSGGGSSSNCSSPCAGYVPSGMYCCVTNYYSSGAWSTSEGYTPADSDCIRGETYYGPTNVCD